MGGFGNTTLLPSGGFPAASRWGTNSEVAHKWADGLHNPCRPQGPQHLRAGDKTSFGPQVGGLAISALPSAGPQHLRGGYEINSGPQMGGLATEPMQSRESPHLHIGGQNRKWPTGGRIGYVTPAIWGRGTKSQVSRKWTDSLCNPCPLGSTQHSIRANTVGSGPQVRRLATYHLLSRGSPRLQSARRTQKWPTCGRSGDVTPAVWRRREKSEVARKWADRLRNMCYLGGT